ncbi:MAG: hypothetical protein K0R17_1609 [Rariglobus sp.]|jgi:hypothetical protein|nr:hypothetical protein [Rariglobus sp.]
MISKHLQFLPLVALLLALPCRADSKKTVIDGHHLENTTVGFYGFAVDIPLAYEPYDPPKEKNFKPKTHADLAWFKASTIDRHAGFTTTEIIPFKYNRRGLVVVVTATTIPIPPVSREKEHLRTLDMFTTWVLKRTGDDFIRDTRKIGDIQIGRAGRLTDGSVMVGNFVLIPPSTLLTFYGACPAAEKDDLLADLDAAIATLNIGKRKLP